MSNSKNIFTSVTVWGIIAGIILQILQRFEVIVPEGALQDCLVIVGPALVALYGRIRATKTITAGRVAPALAFALLCIFLTSCATSPATQAQKDEAGRSEVYQYERNEQGRIVLPANQTITFHGDVGNVVLVDQSTQGDRTNGGGQSTQGSTTTSTTKDQAATGTPTNTVTPTATANVSAVPAAADAVTPIVKALVPPVVETVVPPAVE